ncbi:adenosine receptor A1-like [Cololabis saira]|uniref:adenosine receptor A1-like n=1 Tax=Cololabis saira TaxID=129043 RepID=UPI002AD4E9A8|nr:adenosine receptor A1-like [Cololabis saira]XP_061574441.1 adenosine receptor A1-like [Cololabis saira]
MELMWLYSLCQCTLWASLIILSVRLCMAVSGRSPMAQEATQDGSTRPRSVSYCLRLCLGLVGTVDGAVGFPVAVLLNLRKPQCLYTCITLVCCPLLIRQFTMFLLMLLTLDTHLQHHLAERYSSVVTRQRALCVVLLCWVASVLSSFAQFLGPDVLSHWRSSEADQGTAGLELDGNWTTSLPHLTNTPYSSYHNNRKEIGKFLPYGGFLSKFYVKDMGNFTYAEIHSSHWGMCSPDTIISPQFLVFVHGMTVFILPLVFLLAIYLDLLCMKPRKTPLNHGDLQKHDSGFVRLLLLSFSLLVLLCLPLYIIHALLLFAPNTHVPAWMHALSFFLFQMYGLVPQILFTPPRKQVEEGQLCFPPAVTNLHPAVANSRGKSVHMALREAVQAAPWSSAKHSLKTKVCPEV